MKLASFLLVATALLAGAAAHANDLRFSATLSAADRAAAGLSKLTSDQVAVVDALTRRDTGSRSTTTTVSGEPGAKAPTTFSQRLTTEERQTAGLPALRPEEVAQLDAFVERYQAGRLARTLLAPPTYLTPRSRLTPTERKKEREIHGSFSLSYGVGSGGYSEKTGSMVLTLEDPDRGYSISVGYSESHVKGGYIYRDPFYDRPRVFDPADPFRP